MMPPRVSSTPKEAAHSRHATTSRQQGISEAVRAMCKVAAVFTSEIVGLIISYSTIGI